MRSTSAIGPEVKAKQSSTGGLRRMVQALVFTGLWISAVFVSAGRLDWVRGWICVITYSAGLACVTFLVRRANPGLMAARANWRHKDTKRFDKVILSIYIPLTFVQPAVAGLDAVRFGWSSMPFATVYAGVVLFALAMSLVTWVMMVNPYAEVTVRIQNDREQRPVTTGPYRFVRHPMYVGAILMFPALALIFGSWWALALSSVIAILFVIRTLLEDRTLRRELPEYEEFAAITQYRLIPGVW